MGLDGTLLDDERYVEAVVGPPARVNPLLAPADDAEDDLVSLVFSGLMRIDAEGRPQPDLARSWEVTPDAQTYTFHLRSGLAWHDGMPFTASDVAFTIERLQSGAVEVAPGIADAWAGVEVFVDSPLTVLVRTPEPQAAFLSHAALGILPRHLEGQMAAETGFDVAPFDRQPVGTGPYRLASLDDERAVLERHAGFALGAPTIRHIELRFVEDTAAQIRTLADGDADAALLEAEPHEDEPGMREERPELAETALPRTAYTALYFNNALPPLGEVSLRRALRASVDPVEVFATAGLRGAPGDGVFLPGSWAYAPPDEGSPAGDADALWEAAGWPLREDGRRARGDTALTLQLVTNEDPERERMAQAVAEQLDAHGVTVEVVTMPSPAVISGLHSGEYALAIFGWEASVDPDPYPGWHTSQSGGNGNVARFRDPQADALLEAARTTLDQGERSEFYTLFADRFADQAPAVVLAYPARTYIHPAALQGAEWGLLAGSGSRFHDVHRWTLS
ncbi:MAG: peptide ABC transporter substrate-binding protein [Dehalococcoidia bacterium]